MTLDGKVHIDGCFEGQISSQDSITIGRRGEVRGVVKAQQISVSGLLDAEIHCDELNVERDGRVRGVVHSRHMSIHKRGCFIGERALTADSSLMTPDQLEQLHPEMEIIPAPSPESGDVIELPSLESGVESEEAVEEDTVCSVEAESSPKEGQLTQMLEQMLGEVPTVGHQGRSKSKGGDSK